jgi:hypothetical protein
MHGTIYVGSIINGESWWLANLGRRKSLALLEQFTALLGIVIAHHVSSGS